ncbi:MAG TPA: ATP-binding protein [Thermoanaerobaculia bacterium]|nr:ATP-binding protein [Thermoanaerobaculia bacterium]
MISVRKKNAAASARLSATLGGYAVAAGVLTLIGWGFNIRRLTAWDNVISQMPNNAIAVIAAGAGLICWTRSYARVSAVLGAFAALIGAATVFEHLTAIDLGIDTLVLYREWGQRGTVSPGRMGLPGSVSLVIAGAAIAFRKTRRGAPIATAAGLLTICISMLSIIGYIFGADRLYAIPRLTTIALQTSTMMLALGMGLVAAVPDRQPMRLLLGDSAASLLVRRALPGIVILPLLLGWLALQGQERALFDAAFGAAALVFMLIGLLAVLVWSSASAIAVHEAAMRESRDRVAALLGSITDAFISVDDEWRLVFLNEESEARFGKPRAELLGKTIWEALPDAGGNEPRPQLERAMAARTTVEYEVFYPIWDRWFADRAYPTADGGLAIYSRDITERKNVEEAMRRSAEALRRADRMKDEFLATLSHELRTPLTAIVGWADLLLRGQLDERDMRPALEAIRNSARVQAQLTEDILDVSRITTGKMQLARQHVNLVTIAEAAMTTVRPAAEAKRISVVLRSDGALEPQFVDPERLQQVVWNLLSNAIKFSPAGSRVEVAVHREEGTAAIVVTDDGHGISRDFLPYVFDRFRQGDSSSTRSHGGLGIGLSLAKDLVELHGGTITAESEEGKGSRFAVRLPLTVPAPVVMVQPSLHDGQTSLRGVRVLYVDDREDARTLIATMLNRHGAEVVQAQSADEAMAVLASEDPDVVVTDLAMPDRDGYSLLQAIRADERWNHVPVLALTAGGKPEDERRATSAGFQAFLRKPIEAPALAAAIAQATNPSRA